VRISFADCSEGRLLSQYKVQTVKRYRYWYRTAIPASEIDETQHADLETQVGFSVSRRRRERDYAT
jgi:hypothetical protein